MAAPGPKSPTFRLGFSSSDLIRSVWGAISGALAVFLAAAFGVLSDLIHSCQAACDWNGAKTAGIAAAVALGVAVLLGLKNLVLADGAPLKG